MAEPHASFLGARKGAAAEPALLLSLRLPQPLLDAVKVRAKVHGMPYTRYIRQLLERDIAAK